MVRYMKCQFELKTDNEISFLHLTDHAHQAIDLSLWIARSVVPFFINALLLWPKVKIMMSNIYIVGVSVQFYHEKWICSRLLTLFSIDLYFKIVWLLLLWCSSEATFTDTLTVQIYFSVDYRAWKIMRNLLLQTTLKFKGNRGDCRETILLTDGQ